jgi:transcription antitermination factor NusG
VELEMPLFPGYVFVHFALCDRLKVLQVPGVARLVGFAGVPAVLPKEQIDALRVGLRGEERTKPFPYLTVGRRVPLRNGPFAGLEGILLRRKGNSRVVLSIELIQRSVAVDADTYDLEVLPSTSENPKA